VVGQVGEADVTKEDDHGQHSWPVRSTGEEEIYRVLRRRVLRRALRSRRRPWSVLSRKARVEPEPVEERELLRDAGATSVPRPRRHGSC
jgi:hypothetical protein